MEFKEYSEFDNPEEANYDVKSAIKADQPYNPYRQEMFELLGLLEDVTDEDLMREFGITYNEYLNPTKEALDKVREVVKGYKVTK